MGSGWDLPAVKTTDIITVLV